MSFTVQLEPCALAPRGGNLQMHPGVTDVPALEAELGRQLRLRDVKFLVWDEDFEEWCGLTGLDEIESHVRVTLTAGEPLAPQPAPAPAPAAAPAPVPAPVPAPMTRAAVARPPAGGRPPARQPLGQPPMGPPPPRAADARKLQAEAEARDLGRLVRELQEECSMYKTQLALLHAERERDPIDTAEYATLQQVLVTEEGALMREHNDVTVEKETSEAALKALQDEAAELDRLEQQHWHEFNSFTQQRQGITGDRDSMLLLHRRLAQQDEHLRHTNVFNDTFNIWHDEAERKIGTINGLRLGTLPQVRVEWAEINAAWGEAALLLDTMVRHEIDFIFTTDKQLSPNGSFSQIVDGGKRLDLYGSRLSKVSTFDKGMVAFLQCLKEFGDYAEARDPNFKLPFHVEGDKIGPIGQTKTDRWCSVKRGLMHDDEEWTHALKYMLTNMKFLTTILKHRTDVNALGGGGAGGTLQLGGGGGTAPPEVMAGGAAGPGPGMGTQGGVQQYGTGW
jgi:hypothetical protein